VLTSERSAGWMQRIADGVATPSGTLELELTFRAVELVSGEQVAVVLICACTPAGPHAQAAFTVP